LLFTENVYAAFHLCWPTLGIKVSVRLQLSLLDLEKPFELDLSPLYTSPTARAHTHTHTHTHTYTHAHMQIHTQLRSAWLCPQFQPCQYFMQGRSPKLFYDPVSPVSTLCKGDHLNYSTTRCLLSVFYAREGPGGNPHPILLGSARTICIGYTVCGVYVSIFFCSDFTKILVTYGLCVLIEKGPAVACMETQSRTQCLMPF